MFNFLMEMCLQNNYQITTAKLEISRTIQRNLCWIYNCCPYDLKDKESTATETEQGAGVGESWEGTRMLESSLGWAEWNSD